MKELLDKLTSYNLFANLLPGILFCFMAGNVSSFNLVQSDLLIGAFFYYFVGLVIGRVGSLIIEPLLKFFKVAIFSNYNDFVKASKKDAKIEILSETNNTLRNLIAVIICLFIIWLYSWLELSLIFLKSLRFIILGICMIILFVLSYRKQTKYIYARVNANKKEK